MPNNFFDVNILSVINFILFVYLLRKVNDES